MSRFQALIEDSFPDLNRALALADQIVDGRDENLLPEVEVLSLLCASDDEAARLTAALRAGFQDLRDAIEAYGARAARGMLAGGGQAEAAEMGVQVMIALLRAAQLGCWLGQGRLMSLKDKDLRVRLEAMAAAARRR